MRYADIITLYKNKGDHSNFNNCYGTSLLGIVGRLFACIILHVLQILADGICPESQCSFHCRGLTVDMVFSLHWLWEMCREWAQPLYRTFMDLTRAFGLMSGDTIQDAATGWLSIEDLLAWWGPSMTAWCVLYSLMETCLLVWSKGWSQTRLCACSNPLHHLLCFTLKPSLWVICRWCVPPLQIWWLPLWHLKVMCQDEDWDSGNWRLVVCRWHSHGVSLVGQALGAGGQVLRCLWVLCLAVGQGRVQITGQATPAPLCMAVSGGGLEIVSFSAWAPLLQVPCHWMWNSASA